MRKKIRVTYQDLEDILTSFAKNISGNVRAVYIDEEGKNPPYLVIELAYKTGDGIDSPYSDYPPDEEIRSDWEEAGFSTEVEGTMRYPSGEEGAKWIRGRKSIKISGNETVGELKKIISEHLR